MSSNDPLTAQLASLNIDQTLGAILVGFACSCVAFGILSMQCFSYFLRYPLDKVGYKVLVGVLWVVEMADQILIGHVAYFYTISNFLTPTKILTEDVLWSLIVQVILGNIVGTIVKLCFTMRVWRFSRRNVILVGILLVLIFGQFGLAIAYMIRAFQLNKFALAEKLTLIASLSLGAGALTDIAIAAALTYFLRKMKTGYQQSDTLINGLTRYAINTGALTCAVSIATLVSYDISPTTFIFAALYFVLSKLYAISFVCTLNTRRLVRGRGTDRENSTSGLNVYNHSGNAFYMVTSRNGSRGRSGLGTTKSGMELEIGVQQEVSVVTDGEREYDQKITGLENRT